MSKFLSDSRSPTPTPANSSQTSRRHIPQEHSPQDTQSSGLREESSGLRSIHPEAVSPQPDIPHIRLIRPIEGGASDQRMAKRIRSSDASSNSNSHSRSPQRLQDNVASSSTSNATSIAQDAQSSAAADIAPSKKKRTRTLTTPYQAAVLHGLLAQSRFPTTAKREEVGRQIGLSARKVQIWFQNQRQKARRPRSQSDPNTKHPQYGAFSSVPPPGPEYGVQPPFNTPGADSLLLMQLGSGSSQSLHSAGTPVSTPDSYSSLPDAPLLLGPGVPGLDMHPRGTPLGGNSNISLPQIGQLDTHYPAAGSSRPMHQNSPSTSPAPGHLLPRPLSVPSHLRDAYPTLPPIALGRASISPPGAPSPPLAGSQPYIDTISQPVNMDRPFIHYRPTSPRVIGTPIGGSTAPGAIPPPFTLQPQPQWDRRTFTPSLTRPNIWSPPGSSRSSVSPTQPFFVPYARPSLVPSVSTPESGRDDTAEPVTEEINRNAQPSAPQKPPPHQSRAGRYDPVRAAVIPLTTPSPPPRSSPLPPSDREHMDGRC